MITSKSSTETDGHWLNLVPTHGYDTNSILLATDYESSQKKLGKLATNVVVTRPVWLTLTKAPVAQHNPTLGEPNRTLAMEEPPDKSKGRWQLLSG